MSNIAATYFDVAFGVRATKPIPVDHGDALYGAIWRLVPTEARCQTLPDNAKQPAIGKLIDEAMVAIERDNRRLKRNLPKDFGRPALDKHRLGELIDVIGLGDAENRSKDILEAAETPETW